MKPIDHEIITKVKSLLAEGKTYAYIKSTCGIGSDTIAAIKDMPTNFNDPTATPGEAIKTRTCPAPDPIIIEPLCKNPYIKKGIRMIVNAYKSNTISDSLIEEFTKLWKALERLS